MNLDKIVVKPPLRHWQEILEEWVFMNKKITRITNGKFAPYSYKERTNLGVLASAAVKTGWAALEECRTEKSEKEDETLSYQGRADLLLWRDARNDQVEAKFMRRSLTAPTLKRIEKVHGKARGDAARSTTNESKKENCVALTFIVPWVKSEEKKDDTHGQVEALIDSLYRELKPTIFAYVFSWDVPLVGAEHRTGLGVILIGHAVLRLA